MSDGAIFADWYRLITTGEVTHNSDQPIFQYSGKLCEFIACDTLYTHPNIP